MIEKIHDPSIACHVMGTMIIGIKLSNMSGSSFKAVLYQTLPTFIPFCNTNFPTYTRETCHVVEHKIFQRHSSGVLASFKTIMFSTILA